MTPATALTNELLKEISATFPGRLSLWRNNRIDSMVMGAGGKMRRVTAGIDGQADISGLIGSHPSCICRGDGLMGMACNAPRHDAGRRIEIEVKAGKDRIRPSQESFRQMIIGKGGIYIVARSVDGAIDELRKWL